jgi:hypothetical protein
LSTFCSACPAALGERSLSPLESSDDRNKNGGKKDDENWCRRCKHKHLWKDCFLNPQNQNNKLKSMADKAKETHHHSVELIDVDEEPTVGFNKGASAPKKENKTDTNNGKFNNKKKRKALSNITNHNHHLDCFTIQDLEKSQDRMIPIRVPTSSRTYHLAGYPR